MWLISLASYTPADPVWFFTTGADGAAPLNFGGRVGAFLAELSYQMLGYSAYLLPIVLVVSGWHYFWCRTPDAAYTKLVGAALLFACVSSFLSLAFGTLRVANREILAGGYLGRGLAAFLADYLNKTGSIILILTLLFLSIVLSTQFSFGRLFGALFQMARDRWASMLDGMRARQEERRREQQRQEVVKKHLEKSGADKATKEVKPAKVTRVAAASEEREEEDDDRDLPMAAPLRAKAAARPRPSTKRRNPHVPPQSLAPPQQLCARQPLVRRRRQSSVRRRLRSSRRCRCRNPEKVPAEKKRNGAYAQPPLALLDAPRGEQKVDERELMDGARHLEEKCREFSVEGTVVQIHPGPVVTTYEFKPDAGVKYSKITGLADDLCLAMQAESVLIDRIPGKSTVGIQIPNPNREQISMRELLESEAYRRSTSRLTLALGKTIHGEPFVSDLATMPHLLIAGSTGTGKSVSVNAMLSSILFRASPDEVRLIMIDPKRLELGMYEDIPHLLTPVVVDPKLAANALRWAVREMEERYKTLAAVGVRNIEQYNRNIKHGAWPRATGRCSTRTASRSRRCPSSSCSSTSSPT